MPWNGSVKTHLAQYIIGERTCKQEIPVVVYNDEHDAFDSMDLWLPNGTMENIVGFSEEEVHRFFDEKFT